MVPPILLIVIPCQFPQGENHRTVVLEGISRMNPSTMVPRITTLIRSSEIAVERKRCNAKRKNPLKRIKTRLMHSNGLETHRPVKILHRVAIFGACKARNPS